MVSWLLTGTDPRSAKFPCRSTVNFDDEEDYDPEKDKCVKTIANGNGPKPENDEMCGFSMAVLDSKIYCVGGLIVISHFSLRLIFIFLSILSQSLTFQLYITNKLL